MRAAQLLDVSVGSAFYELFWPTFAAGLLSTGLIVAGAYFFIDRRLHFQERDESRQREATRRWELRQDALGAIADELQHNAGQAQLLAEHLPVGELPYPAFDVNGWSLAVNPSVISVIHSRTLRRIIRIYNRLKTANEYHALVNDLMFGAGAVLAVTSIESMSDAGARSEHAQQFESKRNEMMEHLLDRVRELQPVLQDAREAVSNELDEPPPKYLTRDTDA